MTDAEDTLPYAPTGPSLLEAEESGAPKTTLGPGPIPEATRLDAKLPVLEGPRGESTTVDGRALAEPPPASPTLEGAATHFEPEREGPGEGRGDSAATHFEPDRGGAAGAAHDAPFDEATPFESQSGRALEGRAALQVTRVQAVALPPEAFRPEVPTLGLDETPLSGPPGGMTAIDPPVVALGEGLDEAGPTVAQAFGRPSEVAIVGLKPYAVGPAAPLPTARPGLRVKESVRRPVDAPRPPVAAEPGPRPTAPPRARPTSSSADPPAIGVDPAVYPVTYQVSSGLRARAVVAAAVVVVLVGVGVLLVRAPGPEPSIQAPRPHEHPALTPALPRPAPTLSGIQPAEFGVDPTRAVAAWAPRPRPRWVPTGRPMRGGSPPTRAGGWLAKPAPNAAPSEARDYDVGLAPPSPSPNLYVYSDPPGALVRVNGALWGLAPLSRPAEDWNGPIEVEVFKDGRQTKTVKATPNAEGHYEVFVELPVDPQVGQPLPGIPPPPEPGRSTR